MILYECVCNSQYPIVSPLYSIRMIFFVFELKIFYTKTENVQLEWFTKRPYFFECVLLTIFD